MLYIDENNIQKVISSHFTNIDVDNKIFNEILVKVKIVKVIFTFKFLISINKDDTMMQVRKTKASTGTKATTGY